MRVDNPLRGVDFPVGNVNGHVLPAVVAVVLHVVQAAGEVDAHLKVGDGLADRLGAVGVGGVALVGVCGVSGRFGGKGQAYGIPRF